MRFRPGNQATRSCPHPLRRTPPMPDSHLRELPRRAGRVPRARRARSISSIAPPRTVKSAATGIESGRSWVPSAQVPFYMSNSSRQEANTSCLRRRVQRRYPFAVPVNNGAVPRAARRSSGSGRKEESSLSSTPSSDGAASTPTLGTDRESCVRYVESLWTPSLTNCGAWTAAASGPGRIQVCCGPSRRARRPPRTWSARTGRPRGRGHRRCARPRRAAGIL